MSICSNYGPSDNRKPRYCGGSFSVSSTIEIVNWAGTTGRGEWSKFRVLCSNRCKSLGRSASSLVTSKWRCVCVFCSLYEQANLLIGIFAYMRCAKLHRHQSIKNIESIGLGRSHDVKWTGRVCKTPSGAVLVELSTRLEANRSSVAC